MKRKRTLSHAVVCKDGLTRMLPRKRTWQESVKVFWERVNKDGPGECWLWTGHTGGTMGYGVFWENGNCVRAHRFSFELHKHPVPKGFVVMHKCDNPLCVNPDHLICGTQKQNLLDARVKKRHCHGVTHPACLLTESDVREIRAAYIPRLMNWRMLGEKYNVSASCIQGICQRTTWKHVN